MGDKLIISKKELLRKTVIEHVLTGELNHMDAAIKLSVCTKTISRSLKRYKLLGIEGLIHRSRGKPSSRSKPLALKEKVLDLYQEKYEGFGPTLAAEKLKESDGIDLHAETLRLWLKEAGLWLPRRKRKCHRSRRARKQRFGEMLQLDGSIHQWFEGIDEKQCLMNLVDDATGKTLALMDYGETTRAALSVLKWWIKEAGIPMSIYVDLKSLYVSPKSLKQKSEEGEELVEAKWFTHFSRACAQLGIAVIKAYSPEAKGRVERSHGVYQDRFVKELKLRGIRDIEGANRLLSEGFVNQLNEKFAKAPESEEDAHVPLQKGQDLDEVLCWEYERTVSRDGVIRFECEYYQIRRSNDLMVRPKQKIKVRRHLDGSVTLWRDKEKLDYSKLENKPVASRHPKLEVSSAQRSEQARKNKHKTPWGKFNPDWLKSERSRY